VAVVLDASAMLAYWLDETGADVVEQAIADEGALISSVNLAEAIAKLDDLRAGLAASLTPAPLRSLGEAVLTPIGGPIRTGTITMEPFVAGDAIVSATLRSVTKRHGLSLGDRASLAVAKRLDLEAMTADRSWQLVSGAIGVSVRLIR
jgi:ribonuclease VapC